MPWSLVVGQNSIVEALGRAVAAGRLPQAYLFHGPDGSGKRAAAIALAQALQCDVRGREGHPAEAPCGECNACSRVARLVHPDVRVHMPTPKDVPEEDVSDRLRLLGQDPYAEIDYRRRVSLGDPEKKTAKQSAYRVDYLRNLRSELAYVPVEGRYNVAILTDADAMNPQAANAFLKALEEPSLRTLIILTSSRPQRLLPTIISRCQRQRFDALPARDIEAALIARGAADGDRAALVARMADGSLTQAVQLLGNETLAETREAAVRYIRASYAYAQDAEGLAKEVAIQAGYGRERLKNSFALMIGWVRDLVLAREGLDDSLVNIDQVEPIRKFVTKLPEARLENMADLLQEATGLVERNVHTELLLYALAGALAESMRGIDRRRLYVPLADIATAA
ncbi:DNA polymerase III subunit delta' [soil metagenome]